MSKRKQVSPTAILLRRIFVSVALIAIAFLGAYLLIQGKDIALFNPAGPVGEQQKNLFIFTTILGMAVVIPVFIITFTFAWKYRESNTKAKYTPEVGSNHILEIIWWGIPIIIILILAILTWQTSHSLDPYKKLDSPKEALKVQVVSLQWKWLFIYPDQNIATVNELHIPTGRPVDFEITADSPMNGFWIPKLGTQVYAMNGMTTKLSLQADKAGMYRGQSNNISGEGYADMHFDVVAVDDKAFNAWADKAMDNDGIDWTTYQELAKPSTISEPRTYMLHETNLFTLILGKYMDMPDAKEEGMSHDMMEHMHTMKHGMGM